ncbi:MAG TPA: M23 family metallopeptidase, partial [Gemmatimonadales bacterium]
TNYFEAFPSVFGTRRSYNGSEFIYYHTGLDLYGSSTTPVLAPAAGRVAFASLLTVRGNTTYIDHGWGVFSGFLHQSEILVQPGELVEPGQIVGYVGGTGRVTGPHLHWEVWVGGVPVDPLTWTRSAFP